MKCPVCYGPTAEPPDDRCLAVFCRNHYRIERLTDAPGNPPPKGSAWGPSIFGSKVARKVNGEP